VDSFEERLKARIQQAIAAKRKSPACEEWPYRRRRASQIHPRPPIGLREGVKQGRQRSMIANGLARPDLKLAHAIR